MSNKYVLILTNEEDVTTDYVVLELNKRKIPFLRINTEKYPSEIKIKTVINGSENYTLFTNKKGIYDSRNIISIYYRRPKFKLSTENKDFSEFYERELKHSLIGSLLSQDHRWINNPLNNRNAEFKINQLSLASQIGFLIPNSLITQSKDDFLEFYKENNEEVIIKTIKKGFINGDEGGVIYTTQIQKEHLNDISNIEKFPTYFQEKLKKKYDIRVTIIGKNIFATRIDSQKIRESKTDWRKSQKVIPQHTTMTLPKNINKLCLDLMSVFNLSFGAIDLVQTLDNKYYFLEINPNGQWAWIENQTGEPITQKIVDELIGEFNED